MNIKVSSETDKPVFVDMYTTVTFIFPDSGKEIDIKRIEYNLTEDRLYFKDGLT